jgi:outer membrane lipoprotein-sorting protein
MILAAALIWASAAVAQTPPPSAPEFIAEFTKQRDAVETLRAGFVQTTTNPDETVVSKGTLIYTRPKRLIFRYADPPLVYMIDGLRVYEYDPGISQIEIMDLEDRPESEAFYLGFESNVDRLQKAYEIHVLPPADAEKYALAVEFVPRPRDDGEEPYFQRVRLQLRKKDYLPAEILIVNDDESQTSFTVTDFAANEKLPEELSRVRVPEGTAIVENNESGTDAPAGGALFPREAAPQAQSEHKP